MGVQCISNGVWDGFSLHAQWNFDIPKAFSMLVGCISNLFKMDVKWSWEAQGGMPGAWEGSPEAWLEVWQV